MNKPKWLEILSLIAAFLPGAAVGAVVCALLQLDGPTEYIVLVGLMLLGMILQIGVMVAWNWWRSATSEPDSE